MPTINGRAVSLEGLSIIAGQALVLLGTLFFIKLLTNALDPHQYGQVSLALALGSLINQLITGGINNATSRYYSVASANGQVQQFVFNSAILVLSSAAATVALGVGFFALDPSLSSMLGLSDPLARLGILYAAINAITLYGVSLLNAARKRLIVAILLAGECWTRVICLYAATLVHDQDPHAILILMIASQLIFAAMHAFRIHALHSASGQDQPTGQVVSRAWQFELVKYAVPFSLWGGFTWAQQTSDRWALNSIGDPGAVGKYAVIVQLGYAPIALAMGILTTLLTPIIFARASSGTRTATASASILIVRTVGFTLVVTVGATVAAWILHSRIFELLTSVDFHDNSFLLPILVASGGIFSAGQFLSLKFLSNLSPSRLTVAKIVTAIFGIAANFLGAYLAGLTGVAIASVCFSVIYFTWILILVLKHDPSTRMYSA